MKRKTKTKARPSGRKGIAAKVAEYLQAKKDGLEAYQRADRAMAEIAGRVRPGKPVRLNKAGRKAVLIDRFRNDAIVWTPCAARRWELKIIEP